jgi:hypothetical protein
MNKEHIVVRMFIADAGWEFWDNGPSVGVLLPWNFGVAGGGRRRPAGVEVQGFRIRVARPFGRGKLVLLLTSVGSHICEVRLVYFGVLLPFSTPHSPICKKHPCTKSL